MSKPALVLCLAFAFAAGVAAATLAQGSVTGTYWLSGNDLMELPRTIRLAYTAGAHDMFAAIIELIGATDTETAARTILAADSCLDQRSSGKLGELTDWAETIWHGRQEPAAKLLLLEVCR